MATQRLIVASITGDASGAVKELLSRSRSDPDTVDLFCERLRANCGALPVVYFCEWIDRWLMGDRVPGPGAVSGKRFQVVCLSPQESLVWAGECGSQHQEQGWLAARLHEAASSWVSVAETVAVVIVREVLGASATDDEVRAALHGIPAWLTLDEQRETLRHLSPERRRDLLQALPVEERLVGLSEEEVRQLLDQLAAQRKVPARKPRRKR